VIEIFFVDYRIEEERGRKTRRRRNRRRRRRRRIMNFKLISSVKN
jgi:hypothetical protein